MVGSPACSLFSGQKTHGLYSPYPRNSATLLAPNSCQHSTPLPKGNSVKHRLTCCLQYISMLSPYLLRIFSRVAPKRTKDREKQNKTGKWRGLKKFYIIALSQNFQLPLERSVGYLPFLDRAHQSSWLCLRGRQRVSKMKPLPNHRM